MFSRILAATDFSRPARVAVARAARLAAATGARLDVVHAARPLDRSLLAWLRSKPEAAAVVGELEARLKREIEHADAEGVQVRTHIVQGPPVRTLEATARKLRADLVVLGARGARGFRDQLIGTTAERLVARLSCDVLVVRKPARAAYRKILVGVDTSAASARALQHALQLGEGAEVHVIHAYEPPLESMLRSAGLKDALVEHLQREHKRAADELKAFVRDADVPASRVKIAVRRGYPPHVLERAAARLAPDLLAVGHRTSALAEPFLGSVAKHMLRVVPCDVLVAHPEPSA